ncbi:hypothetical protein DPEC_G00032140 [Dallia pectoralis]|uniref:Uncharacterized protein n=1 Tax=Dallia pectoralis TaxID=75939 RepID=A0ACC2HCC6_DALPE|nr:hypothetical protein DPEC_G00032140 [Dallia pectoralis]
MSGRVKQSTSKSADTNPNDRTDEAKDNDAERANLHWKKMSPDQINTLMDLTVQVQLRFEEILDFGNYCTSSKEAALLDYFVSGFWWAKEMKFTCEQISFIMALLQLLLDNLSEKQMPFGDNLNEFAKLIAGMRQTHSPEVDPLFDAEQSVSITNYLTCSLFENYQLYEFLFTQPREELLLGKECTIEVVSSENWVAPLEEGMSTDVYLRYMAPDAAGLCEERRSQEEEPEEHVAGGSEKQYKEPTESEEYTIQAQSEEYTIQAESGYTIEDVKIVMEDLAKEMLGNLQAEFTEKLRVQAETYSARLEQLKHTASK